MIHYKDIYEKVFELPQYSRNEDRKNTCQLVHDYITEEDKSAVDIGSGRGPVIIELLKKFPMSQILSCDLKKFHELPVSFRVLNLTLKVDRDTLLKEYPIFDFLTCVDVLEHIEEKELDDILKFFKELSKKSLIIVANHSDVWGVELHLIQKPIDWWEYKFARYFRILDKKSLYNDRAFMFYLGG